MAVSEQHAGYSVLSCSWTTITSHHQQDCRVKVAPHKHIVHTEKGCQTMTSKYKYRPSAAEQVSSRIKWHAKKAQHVYITRQKKPAGLQPTHTHAWAGGLCNLCRAVPAARCCTLHCTVWLLHPLMGCDRSGALVMRSRCPTTGLPMLYDAGETNRVGVAHANTEDPATHALSNTT